jgi:hypothetical protein
VAGQIQRLRTACGIAAGTNATYAAASSRTHVFLITVFRCVWNQFWSTSTATATTSKRGISIGNKTSSRGTSYQGEVSRVSQEVRRACSIVSRLLQLGNIDITKLPVVPEFVDATGKNNLCYDYCLGVCPHGDNCAYKKYGGHVNGSKLPAVFVANLCQVIEPAVTAAMKLPPARPSDNKQGPGKRTKFA